MARKSKLSTPQTKNGHGYESAAKRSRIETNETRESNFISLSQAGVSKSAFDCERNLHLLTSPSKENSQKYYSRSFINPENTFFKN